MSGKKPTAVEIFQDVKRAGRLNVTPQQKETQKCIFLSKKKLNLALYPTADQKLAPFLSGKNLN